MYITLVSNACFAKAFVTHGNPSKTALNFNNNRGEHNHPLILVTFEKKGYKEKSVWNCYKAPGHEGSFCTYFFKQYII